MKSVRASLLLLLLLPLADCRAQSVAAIFQEKDPMALRLKFGFKEVKKSRADSIYFPALLLYQHQNKNWDSLHIGIRARGNFRRKYCYLPPLRLKLKKSDVADTPFEGNKSFKLVVPCQGGKSGNTLIAKEYLCYKLLEPVTPYFFHTRLTHITLNDQESKHPKSDVLTGILIEDDDRVADRFHGKVLDQMIHPRQLNDTAAVIHDFFEYMIANTDWSTAAQHNAKVIQIEGNKKVPLSYDYDMAGLVNAPYATVDESLGIRNVKERVYRGYCYREQVMQYVRSEYLRLEPVIMKTIDEHQAYFSDGELTQLKLFIESFFSILNYDNSFRNNILLSCRNE